MQNEIDTRDGQSEYKSIFHFVSATKSWASDDRHTFRGCRSRASANMLPIRRCLGSNRWRSIRWCVICIELLHLIHRWLFHWLHWWFSLARRSRKSQLITVDSRYNYLFVFYLRTDASHFPTQIPLENLTNNNNNERQISMEYFNVATHTESAPLFTPWKVSGTIQWTTHEHSSKRYETQTDTFIDSWTSTEATFATYPECAHKYSMISRPDMHTMEEPGRGTKTYTHREREEMSKHLSDHLYVRIAGRKWNGTKR